jgi:D-alanyl-D-alanine carboxypeptidase
VASVRRNEKHIVAVVLGGTSNAKRDARMRELITQYIPVASTRKTAPMIVETAGQNAAYVDTRGPAGSSALQNAHP